MCLGMDRLSWTIISKDLTGGPNQIASQAGITKSLLNFCLLCLVWSGSFLSVRWIWTPDCMVKFWLTWQHDSSRVNFPGTKAEAVTFSLSCTTGYNPLSLKKIRICINLSWRFKEILQILIIWVANFESCSFLMIGIN